MFPARRRKRHARRLRSPEQPHHCENIRSSLLPTIRLLWTARNRRIRVRVGSLLRGAHAPRVLSSAPPPKTSPVSTTRDNLHLVRRHSNPEGFGKCTKTSPADR